MSNKSDTLDARKRNKHSPLPEETRTRKQQRFLKAFCESGNIKYSCKASGINRSTFYDWQKHDAAFKAQLPEAQLDANDTLEFAAYERAVKGVETFVVSQGHLVYEELPVIGADGEQEVENGRLVYKRGKPIVERKYSDTLLQTLLKANMPDKYKDRQLTELVGLTELLDAEHASLLGDLEGLPSVNPDQKQESNPDTGADSAPPGA